MIGTPDLLIEVLSGGVVRARHDNGTPDIPTNPYTRYEDVLGERYVANYHAAALAAANAPTSGMFTARLAPGARPTVSDMTFEMSPVLDAQIPASWTTDWLDYPGLTLHFPAGRRLNIEGTLNVDAVTLTATNPVQGWSGITIPGGTTVLDGARVEGVSFAGQYFKRPPSAVTVTGGGSLTLTGGATVAGTVDGQGIEAVGEGTTVVIEGQFTRVRDNEQAGVAAHGGADVTIRDFAEVIDNAYGVVASGAGTVVSLGVASVTGNAGPGVTATDLATVQTIVTGTPSAFLAVGANQGGLAAEAGATVMAGTCTGSTCTGSEHEFILNSPGGVYFDARSVTGSTFIAQGNDWGVQGITCLDTEKDGSSTLIVSPIRPSGPPCNPPTERQAGPTALARHAGAHAERGMSDAVLARVVTAEQALRDGEIVAAEAGMRAALALAEADDDREGAFAGAARMLTRADLAGVTTALDSAATTGARPWALAALASGHAAQGRTAEADMAAATLVSEGPPANLAARALGVRTRLSAEAGDEVAALGHLAALYAVSPESSTFVTAAAVVAATFPEADLPGALRPPLPAGDVAAKDGDDRVPAAGLAVHPNPATGRAMVTVALDGTATLDVAVYDALGRRVVVVADGAVAGGSFVADVDVSTLPPGVYLVRTVARGSAGSVVVQVARLTVAR